MQRRQQHRGHHGNNRATLDVLASVAARENQRNLDVLRQPAGPASVVQRTDGGANALESYGLGYVLEPEQADEEDDYDQQIDQEDDGVQVGALNGFEGNEVVNERLENYGEGEEELQEVYVQLADTRTRGTPKRRALPEDYAPTKRQKTRSSQPHPSPLPRSIRVPFVSGQHSHHGRHGSHSQTTLPPPSTSLNFVEPPLPPAPRRLQSLAFSYSALEPNRNVIKILKSGWDSYISLHWFTTEACNNTRYEHLADDDASQYTQALDRIGLIPKAKVLDNRKEDQILRAEFEGACSLFVTCIQRYFIPKGYPSPGSELSKHTAKQYRLLFDASRGQDLDALFEVYVRYINIRVRDDVTQRGLGFCSDVGTWDEPLFMRIFMLWQAEQTRVARDDADDPGM